MYRELAKAESFEPVAAIMEFRDADEALALANDTKYGLAAGVHINDLARAHRFAAWLESGTVWINTFAFLTPSTPYGS